jgi:ATP-dependent helicase/nuclease subunit A
MTIHSAKGLEWDVVLIPSLEKTGQRTATPLLNWLELEGNNGDAAVVLAPIESKGEQASKLSKWMRRMNAAREAAERKRLFYVACTRAREALHLFAACERNTNGELKPKGDTLLASAWPAAEGHFTDETASSDLLSALQRSLEEYDATFAIAASAETIQTSHSEPPKLQRIPFNYEPTQRFIEAAVHRVVYPTANAFDSEQTFERPEGGFTVRAFGNVVHRYLQLLSSRMADGTSAETMLQELPSWQARLTASLRAEGLSNNLSTREATHALAMLKTALTDDIGRWILAPHTSSSSETALTLATQGLASTLRVDRTFVAGPAPGVAGNNTLWIIDFKTSEQGSRTPEAFAEDARNTYGPQLSRYAALLQAANNTTQPIMLGLYYPSVPRLIHWPYERTSR